ncbi:MAG: hypothetical protein ACYDB7_03430 [Mycobacteriales bacterium]
MEHVVFYSGADGMPAYLRSPSLDEALVAVERLRNDLGVSDLALFGLSPVSLSFTPYYRVQIGESAAAAPVTEVPVDVAEEPSSPPTDPIWDEFAVGDVAEEELAEDELVEDELAEVELAEVAEPHFAVDVLPEVPAEVPPAVLPEQDRPAARSLGFFAR